MPRTLDRAATPTLTLAEVIDHVTNDPGVPSTLCLIQDERQVLKKPTRPLNPNLSRVPRIHGCRVRLCGPTPNRCRVSKRCRFATTGLAAEVEYEPRSV